MFHVEQRVIVVGGGHAGIEAAMAAARLGVPVTMVTVERDWIGRMPCNPAIGGLAKGHLVREIDALGGVMGRLATRATMQFKHLNTRKGRAVRSSRAQVDRFVYAWHARRLLDEQPGVDVLLDSVVGLEVRGGAVQAVRTARHGRMDAAAVIVAAGTFMGGRVIVGSTRYPAGRSGESAASGLSASLSAVGLELTRLKTGTTPRLLTESIRHEALEEQLEDLLGVGFSTREAPGSLPRIRCRITYTNERTHEVIRRNLHRAPLFDGTIEGVGPRYCPSIEDKVVRFPGRSRHQIFLEPEGIHSRETYPNGISTSLPVSVQREMIRTIEGLERAVIVRPGYAIEYDVADARQLRASLEVRHVRGLFLAGQVNGTTGYEEAAAQGLMAGINAARGIRGEEPLIIERQQAYIGVLIDDLVTRGTDEPYRMFTSRSEVRLLLREGNADLRLSEMGRSVGLLGDEGYRSFVERRKRLERALAQVRAARAHPGPPLDRLCRRQGSGRIAGRVELAALLARPGIELDDLRPWLPDIEAWADEVRDEVTCRIKYAGYIERQRRHVEQQRKVESVRIPEGLDVDRVEGLSAEVREKLRLVRPETLGQASRIPGVTPAAITALMVHLRLRSRGRAGASRERSTT